MRRLAVLMTLVVVLLLPRAGRGSTPEPSESGVVVVVVAPDAVELDVARVRAAIGEELTSDAVAPDDARASNAHGRIDVSIDRGTRQLVVSYRGDGAEALVRRVDLPGDADATLRAAALVRALDALPIDQRVTVILCEVEERTSAEVASITGVPEGTVRSRLHHARRKLIEALGKEGIR
jgi:RNA polymerase sigma factor (sigma-70 family)